MQRKRVFNVLAAWLVAASITALIGSIVQTQFNLAAVAALDGPVPLQLRLETTVLDLAGFAPALTLIVAAGFAIAFPVAAFLERRWTLARARRTALYALAGATAVATPIFLMNSLLPITAIAATRAPAGLLLLWAAGALGGSAFAALVEPRRAAMA